MMRDWIGTRRVFSGPGQTFGLRAVVKSHVMYFIPQMQAFDDFEGADLPSAGGGVQEVGFHPQDLQTTASPTTKPAGPLNLYGMSMELLAFDGSDKRRERSGLPAPVEIVQ